RLEGAAVTGVDVEDHDTFGRACRDVRVRCCGPPRAYLIGAEGGVVFTVGGCRPLGPGDEGEDGQPVGRVLECVLEHHSATPVGTITASTIAAYSPRALARCTAFS